MKTNVSSLVSSLISEEATVLSFVLEVPTISKEGMILNLHTILEGIRRRIRLNLPSIVK